MALKQTYQAGSIRLTMAQAVWIVLAVAYLAIWLPSLPEYYERVSTLTIEPFRLGERVIFDNPTALRDATQRGVSMAASAAIDVGLDLLGVFVYNVVAVVILLRAPTLFGWLTAFVLMWMGVVTMTRAVGVAEPFAGAVFLVEIPGYLVWPLWLLWLYLFPTGQPVPRWSHLVVVALFIVFMLVSALGLLGAFGIVPPQLDTTFASLGGLAVLPLFGFVLFAQIYRYRKVSTLIERQQTKWFLLGLGIFALTLLLFVFTPDSFKTSVVVQNILNIIFLVFPVSVALAILRYRLFDIDILIRRTLTYTLVTALLVLVFFGSVVLLQQLFSGITGSGQNELVTVLSTLAIAALFVPVRNRVQTEIDKRFNRNRYNSQLVLTDFANTVRDETDLDKLAGRLMQVVDETMQPKSVSVWLKQDKRDMRKLG